MDVTKTYLFYDIETTGLNKCFDQILQFAAIRTDLALNELSRHEIQVRLRPDVIPAAAAVITHRISLQDMQSGMSELEAITQIHQLMNTPGTISVGYNTLKFDDEFLRFSFYRNLLPPYTHQYQNACGRMDLYPLMAFYYLFKPAAIQWPKINDKISLKLENLSQANQLAEGQAHHAMTDVKACVALAKKLRTARDVWDEAIRHFDRNTVQQRHQQLTTGLVSPFNRHREAIIIQGGLGADLNYQAPVIELGPHRHYKNQTLWLRLDQEHLSQITPENIATHTFAVRQRNTEPPLLLPIHQQKISPAREAIVKNNKLWLQQNPQLFQQICIYHQNYTYPAVAHLDIDGALYESGFPSPQETLLFHRFHQADLVNKEKIALSFPNALHKKLAIRALGRHHAHMLSKESQNEFMHYLQNIFDSNNTATDYRSQSRLTPVVAMQQIDELKKQALDEQQQGLLIALQDYLQNLLTEII